MIHLNLNTEIYHTYVHEYSSFLQELYAASSQNSIIASVGAFYRAGLEEALIHTEGTEALIGTILFHALGHGLDLLGNPNTRSRTQQFDWYSALELNENPSQKAQTLVDILGHGCRNQNGASIASAFQTFREHLEELLADVSIDFFQSSYQRFSTIIGNEKVQDTLKKQLIYLLGYNTTTQTNPYHTLMSNTILLTGDPGVGKSLSLGAAAQYLTDNAALFGVPYTLLRIEKAAIYDSRFGVSEQRLTNYLKQLTNPREITLCLIDELDSLGASRYEEGNEAKKSLTSILLESLDGLNKQPKVMSLLLAATNLDYKLDPALRSRFGLALRVKGPETPVQWATYIRHQLQRLTQGKSSTSLSHKDYFQIGKCLVHQQERHRIPTVLPPYSPRVISHILRQVISEETSCLPKDLLANDRIPPHYVDPIKKGSLAFTTGKKLTKAALLQAFDNHKAHLTSQQESDTHQVIQDLAQQVLIQEIAHEQASHLR